MNIMNKLYKCALGLLTAFILSFASFSSAFSTVYEDYGFIEDGGDGYIFNPSLSYNTQGTLLSTTIGNFSNSTSSIVIGSGYQNIDRIICFYSPSITNLSSSNLTNLKNFYGYLQWNVVNFTQSTHTYYKVFNSPCMFYSSGAVSEISMSSSVSLSAIASRSLYYKIFSFDNIKNNYRYIPPTCPTCPTCPSQYTSLECQTEYNLIPINEVTANYCALNFGMIDPQECPINEGTGAIVRSNLMINDIPYAQNQNINVFIPDFLAWNIAFNDLYTTIEVEGYNADETYIENVINQEKLTPTNKDIEEMITGFMINYFPYLALAIVFLYLARKIFKLFK